MSSKNWVLSFLWGTVAITIGWLLYCVKWLLPVTLLALITKWFWGLTAGNPSLRK